MVRGERADVKLKRWVEVHTNDDGGSLALNILEKYSVASQRRRGGGARPDALGGVYRGREKLQPMAPAWQGRGKSKMQKKRKQ